MKSKLKLGPDAFASTIKKFIVGKSNHGETCDATIQTPPAAGQAAHTPTPYKAVSKPDWLPDDDISIINQTGRQVCCVRRLSGHAAEADATAAFIVRACNENEKLRARVTALMGALQVIKRTEPQTVMNGNARMEDPPHIKGGWNFHFIASEAIEQGATPQTDALWLNEYPHDQPQDKRLERVLEKARLMEGQNAGLVAALEKAERLISKAHAESCRKEVQDFLAFGYANEVRAAACADSLGIRAALAAAKL